MSKRNRPIDPVIGHTPLSHEVDPLQKPEVVVAPAPESLVDLGQTVCDEQVDIVLAEN